MSADDARKLTEESEVSFYQLCLSLKSQIEEAAKKGLYSIPMPSIDSTTVKSRLLALLDECGYWIVTDQTWYHDTISWKPAMDC
jgi:hypothetical protein